VLPNNLRVAAFDPFRSASLARTSSIAFDLLGLAILACASSSAPLSRKRILLLYWYTRTRFVVTSKSVSISLFRYRQGYLYDLISGTLTVEESYANRKCTGVKGLSCLVKVSMLACMFLTNQQPGGIRCLISTQENFKNVVNTSRLPYGKLESAKVVSMIAQGRAGKLRGTTAG
jgi:hypothetical protein